MTSRGLTSCALSRRHRNKRTGLNARATSGRSCGPRSEQLTFVRDWRRHRRRPHLARDKGFGQFFHIPEKYCEAVNKSTSRSVTSPTDFDSDEHLRASVRERLADGRLLWGYGASTVRRGSGRPCDVCGTAITIGSVEREVQGDPGWRGKRRRALAHDDCYRLWRQECLRLQSPPPPA